MPKDVKLKVDPSTAPAVKNPDAAAVLKAAAAHVGLDLEALLDLVVDGGYVDDAFARNTPALTEQFTLEDLGGAMAAVLHNQPGSRRAEFYEGLSPTAQKALVTVLASRGYGIETIALDLQLEVGAVMRTVNEHADALGSQVVGLRMNTIAGHLQLAKDRAQAIEQTKGNGRALWAIEKEFLQSLQSLGVVDRAAHKFDHEHTVTFGAQKKAEIDAMVAMQLKMVQAQEEMKMIDAEITDAVPEVNG